MAKQHLYNVNITWTGNQGEGTADYKSYSRDHLISIDGKVGLSGSSDAAFRGDKAKHNPEDLLISSLSACHMLWYLHLCSQAGIVVVDYVDNAVGVMAEHPDGSGHFKEAILHPIVTVADTSMITAATELHEQANKHCFIANSVNFPVRHHPKTVTKA